MTPDTTKPGALAFLRTLIVVTLVSVLIWIVAEGESVSRERVETSIRLIDGDGGVMIRPLDPTQWNGRLLVALEGSTTEVSNLSDRLRETMNFRPGDPGVPTEPGRHVLDIAEILRGSRAFEGSGVTLVSVEPESVGVMVDRVTSLRLGVRVDVPEAASASSLVVDPSEVAVQVPSLLADRFAGMQALVARLTPEQIAGLEVGRRNVIGDVPLELPADLAEHPFVRLEPDSVNVTVTLDSRQDSITLPNVPVQIRRPAFESELWVVTVNPEDHLLENVTVTGPSELIEQIRSGRLTIFATVVLTLDDRDAGIAQKDVIFTDLPTPLAFDAPNTTVRLSIRRVNGEAGAP